MKKTLIIALTIGMAVMGSVVPISASISSQNTVTTAPLPLGGFLTIQRVNVSKNIDGNQGTQIFSSSIINRNISENFDTIFNFEIAFSAFTNMTDLNVALYIGDDRVEERMNVSAGTRIGFSVPATVSTGTGFRVVVSSNSANADASASMQIRSS